MEHNSNDIKDYIIEKINTAIEESGLSLYEICKTINKKIPTLKSWKTGNSCPSSENLYILASALNKPISYFFPLKRQKKEVKKEMKVCQNFIDAYTRIITSEEIWFITTLKEHYFHFSSLVQKMLKDYKIFEDLVADILSENFKNEELNFNQIIFSARIFVYSYICWSAHFSDSKGNETNNFVENIYETIDQISKTDRYRYIQSFSLSLSDEFKQIKNISVVVNNIEKKVVHMQKMIILSAQVGTVSKEHITEGLQAYNRLLSEIKSLLLDVGIEMEKVYLRD